MKVFFKKFTVTVLCVFGLYNASFAQDTVENSTRSNNVSIKFKMPSYTISDTVLPAEYGVSQTFKYIHMSDDRYGIIDSVGLPILPQKTYTLSLPANVQNISVSVTNTSYITTSLTSHILPCQEDVDKSNPVFNYSINSTYYSSSGGAFNATYAISDTFDVHGVKGVSLSIMPFTYNPAKKKLSILQRATITVSYTCDSLGDSSYTVSPVWDDYLSRFFDNYTPTIRDNTSAGRYLIITHPMFANTIQQFADYKRNIGYDVNVVSTGNSNVTANLIKAVISAYYFLPSTRPDFVLLVGDHQYIPAAAGDPTMSDDDDPITDLPYSQIPGVDEEPDVFIGRFPVSDTNQLKTIVNKTISMEMNLPLYEKKAKFIAGYDDNNPWMELGFNLSHDLIANTYEANGYDCQLLYQKTFSEIQSALNDDPYLFIYSGHGSCTDWSIGNAISLDASFLANSAHTTYPIAIAFACQTGNFAYSSTSIGEHWIREPHGGICHLGSSVNTRAISDMILEKKILKEAFFETSHIGSVVALGKYKYKSFYTSFFAGILCKRFYKSYNLVGDPSFLIDGIGCKLDMHVTQYHLRIGDTSYFNGKDTVVTNDNFIVDSGGAAFISANQEVILSNGTYFRRGALGHIRIQNCCPQSKNGIKTNNSVEKNDINESYDTTNEMSPNRTLSVHPNPTQDITLIEYELPEESQVTISLYAVTGGKQGILIQGFRKAGVNVEKIDLSRFPKGIYVIRIISQHHSYSCKIIRN